MNSLEQLVRDIVVLLRSLFESDDPDRVMLITKGNLTIADRAKTLTDLVTDIADSAGNTTEQIKRTREAVLAAQTAAKIASKMGHNPKLVADTVARARLKRAITAPVLKPGTIGRPMGWLGKLTQWGHLFQSQYFRYLWEHEMHSFRNRAGMNDKRSGPNYKERRLDKMSGKLWSYIYAEPPPPMVHGYWSDILTFGRKKFATPSPFSDLALFGPEASGDPLRLENMFPRAPSANLFAYAQKLYDDKYTDNQIADITQTLFSPAMIEGYFSRVKDDWFNLDTERKRLAQNWMRNARWLVWAAEGWRANSREPISDTLKYNWVTHTQLWAVGFSGEKRLANRKLFGSELQSLDGKVSADLSSNTTAAFNTERLLQLVIQNTPYPWEVGYDTLSGSLCDWTDDVSGAFRPSFNLPKDWHLSIDNKRKQSLTRNIGNQMWEGASKTAVSIVVGYATEGAGAILGGWLGDVAAQIGGDQIIDGFREWADTNLWGTLNTALGRLTKIWESEIQDAYLDIWGLAENLQKEVERAKGLLSRDTTRITGEMTDYFERVKDKYAFVGDLYGEIIALPKAGKEMDYFRF